MVSATFCNQAAQVIVAVTAALSGIAQRRMSRVVLRSRMCTSVTMARFRDGCPSPSGLRTEVAILARASFGMFGVKCAGHLFLRRKCPACLSSSRLIRNLRHSFGRCFKVFAQLGGSCKEEIKTRRPNVQWTASEQQLHSKGELGSAVF